VANQKVVEMLPIVWANSLDQVGGPPNLSMKTKLKELRPFLFRLVEEKVHPIPKMKYQEGGILAKVSAGKEFRWIIHSWYITYQNCLSF
jgi:hypothetical protein